MKKIMALLGAIGLVATTSSAVISCDISKTEVKNLKYVIDTDNVKVSVAEDYVKSELTKEADGIEADIVLIFDNKANAEKYMDNGDDGLVLPDEKELDPSPNYYYLLSTTNKDEIGFKFKGNLNIAKLA